MVVSDRQASSKTTFSVDQQTEINQSSSSLPGSTLQRKKSSMSSRRRSEMDTEQFKEAKEKNVSPSDLVLQGDITISDHQMHNKTSPDPVSGVINKRSFGRPELKKTATFMTSDQETEHESGNDLTLRTEEPSTILGSPIQNDKGSSIKRPVRARKARTYDDFVVSGREGNFVTSTPMISKGTPRKNSGKVFSFSNDSASFVDPKTNLTITESTVASKELESESLKSLTKNEEGVLKTKTMAQKGSDKRGGQVPKSFKVSREPLKCNIHDDVRTVDETSDVKAESVQSKSYIGNLNDSIPSVEASSVDDSGSDRRVGRRKRQINYNEEDESNDIESGSKRPRKKVKGEHTDDNVSMQEVSPKRERRGRGVRINYAKFDKGSDEDDSQEGEKDSENEVGNKNQKRKKEDETTQSLANYTVEDNSIEKIVPRKRGRPPKYLSQRIKEDSKNEVGEKIDQKPEKNNGGDKDYNPSPNQSGANHEVEDDDIEEIVPRKRGRPPKHLSQKRKEDSKKEVGEKIGKKSEKDNGGDEGYNPSPNQSGANHDFEDDDIEEIVPRKRGRPPKHLSQKRKEDSKNEVGEKIGKKSEEDNGGDDYNPSPNQSGANHDFEDDDIEEIVPRKRGRPRKHLSQKWKESSKIEVGEQVDQKKETKNSTNQSAENYDVEDDDIEEIVPRKRGRPPKYPGKKRPVATPPKAAAEKHPKKSPIKVNGKDGACLHCDFVGKDMSAVKHHMVSKHALLWTKRNPEGEDNPALIIKRFKYVGCPKCEKKFRFVQYYRHHLQWCGKEDQYATCPECQKSMRAMWLEQHMGGHRAEERRKREKEELERQKEEERKNAPSQSETTETEAEKKLKRQAAKSALHLITSCQDQADDKAGASGESDDDYKGGEDDEEEGDGDDDDEDEGDEEFDDELEEEMNEDGKPRRTRPNVIYERKRELCPEKLTSALPPYLKDYERMAALDKFYADQEGDPVFSDLRPLRDQWELLSDSASKEYLPPLAESMSFSMGRQNCDEMDANKLKFGEILTQDDITYCFTGGPIWSMEWCPLPQGTDQSQVAAVASDPFAEEPHNLQARIEVPGLIQFWEFAELKTQNVQFEGAKLAFCLAHKSGYVRSMSWCPHRAYDSTTESLSNVLPRLGLLAVAGMDSKVSIFSIPHPSSLRSEETTHSIDQTQNEDLTNSPPPSTSQPGGSSTTSDLKACDKPLVYKPKPCLVLTPNVVKGCGPCLCVAWQTTGELKYIVAGYKNGSICVWDLTTESPLLKVDSSTLRPLRYIRASPDQISDCAWCTWLPGVFGTMETQKGCTFWDVSDTDAPKFCYKSKNREFFYNTMCSAGPLHRAFFVSKEKVRDYKDTFVPLYGLQPGFATSDSVKFKVVLTTHASSVWAVSFCPYFEVAVSCDAAGSVQVSHYQCLSFVLNAGKISNKHIKSTILNGCLYKAKMKKKKSTTTEKDTGQHTEQNDKSSDPTSSDMNCEDEHRPEAVTSSGSNASSKAEVKNAYNPENQARDYTLNFINAKECLRRKSNYQQDMERPPMNLSSVNQVKLNPNRSSFLWLLSGSQSGLLRLENIYPLVNNHCLKVQRHLNLSRNNV